jgi:hypothetical protein
MHATNVLSGHIYDELTDNELLTRQNISRVTFQRWRNVRTLVGTSTVEVAIDSKEITIPAAEYRLFDELQEGLENSTDGQPYTFIWLIPEKREPLFPEVGVYFLDVKFYPQTEGETILKLPFEVTVT